MDQALLSHLLARMQADVDFLAAQSLLNQQDADLIRSKLPSVSAGPLHQQLGQLNLHGGAAAQSARVVLPPPASPAPAAPQPQNVRALWDYAATQPDDLGFSKGDVIVLEAEENADWWRGSLNGKSGLFPSNYCERINSPSAPPTPSPAPPSAYPSSSASTLYPNSTGTSAYSSAPSFAAPSPSQQPQYPYQQPQPYAAQHQPSYGAPSSSYGAPPNQWEEKKDFQQPNLYANHPPPPPAPAQPQATPPPIPDKKNKHKFAGRMGTAFAGGVGFGTGSAIANNAINAIF